MSRIAVLPLAAASYLPHRLHHESAAWVEKNCYIDVWIEALHALGLEPLAMLGFTLALDFEGDQFTFFKPPLRELSTLYGVEANELNVWRDLLTHSLHHVAEGKLIFTEADAFWLPDTAGTDYRRQHTKSTIVINAVDVEAQTLGYFHNAGYYELQGEDFVETFRIGKPFDPAFMPLFAEFARVDRRRFTPAAALARAALPLLAAHHARRPAHNPIARFAPRFIADVEWLKGEGLPLYHGYAFATLRQLGANFELAAAHLDWLREQAAADFSESAEAFRRISEGAKALVLKTARAVQARRQVDFVPLLDEMAKAWDDGMQGFAPLAGG